MSSKQLAHRSLNLLDRTASKRAGKVPAVAGAEKGSAAAGSKGKKTLGKGKPKMKRRDTTQKASAEQRQTQRNLAKIRAKEEVDNTVHNLKFLTQTMGDSKDAVSRLLAKRAERAAPKKTVKETEDEEYEKYSLFSGFDASAPLPTLQTLKQQSSTQASLKGKK